jgi:hypothetical protein
MENTKIEEALRLYASYKKMAKEAEEQMQEMSDWIIGYMDGANTQRIESEHGEFKIAERAAWTFTDAVKGLKEAVKKAEEKEKETGEAKSSTTRFLTVKLAK